VSVDRAEVEDALRCFLDGALSLRAVASAGPVLLNNAIVAHQLDRLALHGDGRAVAVFRDPRDQYVSQLLESPFPHGCDEFVPLMEERLLGFERLLASPVGERVLPVCFERYVAEEDARATVVDWLGLDPAGFDPERETFDPARSSRNVGIHRDHHSSAEIEQIHRRLGPIYDRLRG
jgi:hypothetical protein